MTQSLPDYTQFNVPDSKHPEEYTHHERRAELFRTSVQRGTPFAVHQTNQADRYDVDRSTISRDMDRLRESVADTIGDDAKLTTKTLFERALLELRQADDWRATKAAFDMAMDWNDWLADIGEQHREPDRSELDIDMRSRQSEISYQIVREADNEEELPTTGNDNDSEDGSETIDYEELGFTSGPSEIDVETEEGGSVDE